MIIIHYHIMLQLFYAFYFSISGKLIKSRWCCFNIVAFEIKWNIGRSHRQANQFLTFKMFSKFCFFQLSDCEAPKLFSFVVVKICARYHIFSHANRTLFTSKLHNYVRNSVRCLKKKKKKLSNKKRIECLLRARCTKVPPCYRVLDKIALYEIKQEY